MTQDTDSDSTPHAILSKLPSYFRHNQILPQPGNEFAPRTLTFKRRSYEIAQFFEHYETLCDYVGLTDSPKKCKKMLPYCSTKVAKMVETLPSYHEGDFSDLEREVTYFLEKEEDRFSITKIRSFMRKSRKQKIETSTQFRSYHMKFLELIGSAVSQRKISRQERDLYFWGGIHSSLKKRIEHRMLAANQDLDIGETFKMKDVADMAREILKRHRFDEDLLQRADYDPSDSDSEDDDYRPKRIASDSESDREYESDNSYIQKKPPYRKVTSSHDHKPTHRREPPRKKSEEDDVSRIITQMEKLSLHQLRKVDQKQKAHLTELCQNLTGPPRNPPDQSRNRFNPNPPQANGFPPRDLPPHRPQNGPPRSFPDRVEMYCFGCGNTGHRIFNCGELNALINQGVVVRNHTGRLEWPDGSRINRERDEPWVHTINKSMKRSNIVTAEMYHMDKDETYPVFGVTREESDASSEEQEELGWTSGQISDSHAYGVERNPGINRNTRRQVNFDPPSITQGVEKFPNRRNAIGPGRQGPIINKSIDPDRDPLRGPKRITPFDANKDKFEGKIDNQFLPMEIDQVPIEKPGDKQVKVVPDKARNIEPVKMANPRTTKGRSTSEIVQQILGKEVTVSVEEAAHMSPHLRRDLVNTLKEAREVSLQAPEKREKVEKVEKNEKGEKAALQSRLSQPSSRKRRVYVLGEPRDDLLKFPVKIGRSIMSGVYDSGSQVNVLSDKFLSACGLPVTRRGTENLRISGVNGGVTRCVGRIPKAKIYLTENELQTEGELIVIKDAGFDLLLGRPWITMNKAGTYEEEEGTYLTFTSEGWEYDFNVLPNPNYTGPEIPVLTVRKQRRKNRNGNVYAVAAAKRAEISEVPDSEIERIIPQDEDTDNEPDTLNKFREIDPNEEADDEADHKADEPTDEETDEQSEERSDEEAYAESQCWTDPPQKRGRFIDSEDSDDNMSMIIESDLHESYIKMLKKGIREDQWEAFCRAERARRKRDKDKWNEWKRDRNDLDVPTDPNSDPEFGPSDPPEPSETLATMEYSEKLPPSGSRKRKPTERSVVTAARRSQRVRKESRKARESDWWQQNMHRGYERDEKITRKTVTCRDRKAPTKVLTSYGAKASLPIRGRDQIAPQDFAIIEGPPVYLEGNPVITIEAPKNRSIGIPEAEASEDRPRDLVWPIVGNTRDDPSPRPEKNAISRWRRWTPPQHWEELTRRNPFTTPVPGWRTGPLDEEEENFLGRPWISRQELEIALELLENLAGTRGKQFKIYCVGEDGFIINLGPGIRHAQRPQELLQSNRVVEFWRGTSGVLTVVPKHDISCIEAPPDQRSKPCMCQDKNPIIINYEVRVPAEIDVEAPQFTSSLAQRTARNNLRRRERPRELQSRFCGGARMTRIPREANSERPKLLS